MGGQVYVQADTVGLVSYHFDEGGPYISYEAALGSFTTDDGQPFPARKRFSYFHYEPATRTFRGEVQWAPTSVHGSKLWTYEMIFDNGFSRIIGGKALAFSSLQDTRPTASSWFGTEVLYRR